MYAVIHSGGKQAKVHEGTTVNLELLGGEAGDEVVFTPVMVVDGDQVHVGAEALSGAQVTGVVIGEVKGPKVIGFRYKPKANERKRFGHRQRYTSVSITKINLA
ncbi:MAG: 50S ribosomal protein L21 [Ferrimicrobium sp.]